MGLLKNLLKVVLYLIVIGVLLFGGLLAYSTFTDYKPAPTETLTIEGTGKPTLPGDTFSVLIWNVGYAGLGKEMDFFFDGGKAVRADKEMADKYLKGITGYLGVNDTVDFILLQEVDKDSKRSYNIDQQLEIGKVLPGYAQSFALNYNCKFVPSPFALPYTPYGKTYGGLLSLAKYKPSGSIRYQYPGSFGWPTKLYMLDRCFEVLVYKLPNGKELQIINTHNTAFDETGEIKKVELKFLKDYLEGEHTKGNYVVMGGDWNQCPPGVNALQFNKNIAQGYTMQSVDSTLLPKGWSVSFDASKPTNRSNLTAYQPGASYTTLIDYFLTSPNVKVLSVKTIDLGFENSDHQPVYLKVALK